MNILILIIIFLIFIILLYYSMTCMEKFDIPKYWSTPNKSSFVFYPIENRIQSAPQQTNLNWVNFLISQPEFYTKNFRNYKFYQKFLDTLNAHIWDRSLGDIISLREQNKKRLENAISVVPKQNKIPSITHCVWVSHHTNPYLIPEMKIERFYKQISNFPKTFTHYMWFYNLGSNLGNIKLFKKYNYENRNIVFLDILNESVIVYGKDLFDIYYEKNRYTFCSDIVRFNLVYSFGGIYFDIGTIFNFNAEQLLWLDYFSYQEGFINSTTTIAAKPRSIVYYSFLNLIDNLYRIRGSDIQNLELPNKMPSWSALAGYTWVMDNFLNSNEVFLPIDQSTELIETNHMGSWVEGSLGQPSLRNNPIHTNEYLFARRTYNPTLYSEMSDNWGRKFTKYFADHLGVSMETIQKNRKKIEQTFYDLVYNKSFPRDILKDPTIPRILHKCWLTHNRELNQEQLLITLQTYRLLKNSYFKWEFIFWTNKIANIPKSIEFLKKYCPDMQIREIDQNDVEFARFIYEAFLGENRFANANDIFRANIIYKYGGVYIDMGVNIQYDISSLMIPFENIGVFHDGLIDSGILGARAKDPYWKDWLTFLDQREYKNFDKGLFDTPIHQMPITGCHFQMTLLDTHYSDRKVLILQDGFYIDCKRMGSWYGVLKMSKLDLWNI